MSARFFAIRNSHQNSEKLKNGNDTVFFVVFLSECINVTNKKIRITAIFQWFSILMTDFDCKKSCRQKISDNFFSNSTSFPRKNMFGRFNWGRRLNSKKNYHIFFVRKIFLHKKHSSELQNNGKWRH